MGQDQDLFDPTEAGKDMTRDSQAPANKDDGAAKKSQREGASPRERRTGHPDDLFIYTEGEYEDPDAPSEPVDIYAEPAELYEDADEDEILDAEEEITEETVAEAIEDAIEEVEADIEERSAAGYRRSPALRACMVTVATAGSATPMTSPVSAFTPEGMSIAKTGSLDPAAASSREAISPATGRSSPMPSTASTITAAPRTASRHPLMGRTVIHASLASPYCRAHSGLMRVTSGRPSSVSAPV